MVADCSWQIRALAEEGSRILATAHPPMRTSSRTTAARVGGNLLAEAFGEPFFRSAFAKDIGSSLLRSQAEQQQAALDSTQQAWAYRVQQFLNMVSEANGRLTIHGNSAALVGRFARTQQAARAETRLRAGARFLHRLAAQPLVTNGDIPQLLRERAVKAEQDRQAKAVASLLDLPNLGPGFEHQKFPDRPALDARLASYPDARRILDGAIDAFLGQGPDANRQSLDSARTALEGLARQITGENQWKNAVARVSSESTRKVFKGMFDFLSSKGSHGTKPVSKADAEFGIQQVIACMLWLVNHEADLGPEQSQTTTTPAAQFGRRGP